MRVVILTEKDDKLFQSYDTYQISLGEVLRGERATLGKTLEQVQADLKIKKEFIIAIEKCELSGLDNRSFIAGYVRTYARYLGLDPESVYEKFCEDNNPAHNLMEVPEFPKSSASLGSLRPCKPLPITE